MDANVLFDIVDVLKRLQNQLESQSLRLATIEHSIHSQSNSPSHGGSSLHSAPVSPLDEKPLPETPQTPFGSISAKSSPAELYQASILELRKRFEFDDRGDDEDLTYDSQLTDFDVPGVLQPALAVPYACDNDAYSVSNYTMQLSRLELRTPQKQSKPSASTFSDINKSGDDVMLSGPAPSTPDTPTSSRNLPQETASSDGAMSDEISVLARETHNRAALSFYAYETFKTSLHSSRSLRSEERMSSRAEAKRLKCLAFPFETRTKMSDLPKDHKRMRGLELLMNLRRRFYNRDCFVDIVA